VAFPSQFLGLSIVDLSAIGISAAPVAVNWKEDGAMAILVVA
jgi:hypothetical protein